MTELKPCPFCGGEAVFGRRIYCAEVYCSKCHATIGRVGLDAAIEAWNRRAENEELKFTRKFIHDQGLEFALASAWNRRAEDGK